MPIGEDYRETEAVDRFQKQKGRAEAASASIRGGETCTAREPGIVHIIRGEVGEACEAASLLRSRISNLSGTLLGEVPETDEKQPLVEGPPYGGEMADLFYVVQNLRGILSEANRTFSRLERFA